LTCSEEVPMTFGQEIVLALIETGLLGLLVLIAGFVLNRALERHKSDLEWQKVVAADRAKAYRQLWALTRGAQSI
jgi:hypothetical protein